MVKRIVVLFLLLVFVSLASADIKETLVNPKRYVSCVPSLTEILYGLGLEDQIVGVTTHCNFPKEASKKDKVGGVTMNLERIINLRPDKIFLLEDAQKRDIDKMKKFNLPLFVINPHSVKEVMDSILELGRETNRQEVADYMVKVMRDRIGEIAQKIKSKPKKKVFLIIGHRPLTTVGRNNFINDIITLAGGENIGASSASPYPQFNYEQVFTIDPEAIIVLNNLKGKIKFKTDPRWKTLSAVRNNMVLFIEPDIVARPTPRLVGAIEEIALFLHNEN